MSLSFTRSWAGDSLTSVSRDRREFSGGLSYFLKPELGVFGSVGRTIATTDDNGAGTTIGGGVTFLMSPRVTK